ncbi:DUF6417 family protein [Streptomyces sp. BH097]|uniref:DUF6417 family protein n=1 Tax=unclassified Streptomyces TaxID=2593676 RepID=UPI003BB7917B
MLLQRIAAAQGEAEAWVTPSSGITQRSVDVLADRGLARMASDEKRNALSSLTGRRVHWAAQLTDDGWDALLYAQARAATTAPEETPPELQELLLLPSEMAVLRRYLALGPRLRRGPAPGLEDVVESARFDQDANRWTVHVNLEQQESMARAFYLERLGGSAGPANRFARAYGTIYSPC